MMMRTIYVNVDQNPTETWSGALIFNGMKELARAAPMKSN
jgi:hypothetical protein